MRLAISNIAWDVSEDGQIAALLRRYGIDAIDIAPGKYFPKPEEATNIEIARVKDWWSERGVEITGMQALLFGTVGLNLFGSSGSQAKMLQHLGAVCSVAERLGATRLVFGSPKNRDRSLLSDTAARGTAISFFRDLGKIAERHGVVICLEPNPTCYGANFMTTTPETAAIVQEVSHPSIRMQLDTGAITINNEDFELVIAKYSSLFGHIHASEPHLVTLGEGIANHSAASSAIRKWLPECLVSIEMLPPKIGTSLLAVEHALALAVSYYGDAQEHGTYLC